MSECPRIDTLEALVSGRLADAVLLEHVSSCDRCRARSKRHRSDRDLLAELGAAIRGPDRSQAAAAPAPLPVVEGHEVLREIHRGGQGVVFEALQLAPRRKVALKVLLEGVFASAERLRRFEREIELVATLRHPNLVTVHQSGRSADGRHWFTMEYVVGTPLDEYAAQRRAAGWSKREALGLFAKVCAAVAYAHRRGVVHRDLKPGNVLVDATGEPRVLDFGLAKELGGEAIEGAPVPTRTGQFVGTLAYASPEQVRGDAAQIDVRTDVYSLGLLLHELLEGRLPYASHGSMAEAVDAILHVVPRPPKGCDDELSAILAKALEKEPERRYASASALLLDVERYLRGEPIEAKSGRTAYLLRKALARHKIAAAVAIAFLAVVVAAAIVSTWFARAAIEAADRTERHARTARRVSRFVQEMLWSLNPDLAKGRNVTVREVLDEQARRVDVELADEPEALSALHSTIARTYASLGLDDEAERHALVALSMSRRGIGELNARIGDLVTLASIHRERCRREDAERFLAEASALLDADPDHDPAARAAVLNEEALLRFTFGDPAGAETRLEQALALLRRSGRVKEAATLLANHGLLLLDRGDAAAAEARLRESLDLLRERGDLERLDVAGGLRHLGHALAAQERHDEAIAAISEAHELRVRLVGEKDPVAILHLAELAAAVARRDGYPAAEPLHRRARDLRPALAEREQLACANALHELSRLAALRGDIAEADEMAAEEIARFERMLGREHRYVAIALAGRSWLLALRGRLADAEAMARDALELERRVGGGSHLRSALLNLAWIVLEAGRPGEAEPLAREALDLEQARSDRSRAYARVAGALAWILHCRGDDAAAEPLSAKAVEAARFVARADDGDLATCLHGRSEILVKLERLDEAESLVREALAIRRARGDPGDPELAMCLDALGRQLLERRRFDESRGLLEEALELRRRRFPGGHLHLVWSLENVGAWHFYRRDFAAAETLFQEAVDAAREVLGDGHPELGVALCNLASVLLERGDAEAAVSLLAEALDVLRPTRGLAHPLTRRALEQRIRAHRMLGESSEAAECAELLQESLAVPPQR